MTPGDEQEMLIFARALGHLKTADRRYESNWNVFVHKWESPQRLRWINHMKRSAAAGLPLAQTLISKVIELRLLG